MELLLRLDRLNNKVASLEIERTLVKRKLKASIKQEAEHKQVLEDCETAMKFLRAAGQGIRERLFTRLSETVSYALEDVFGEDAYEFEVQSNMKGRRLTIDFNMRRGERTFDPLEACGHGVADVVSFALRMALLSMHPGPKRAVLLLDEPFRNVSTEYKERVGMFLRKVCTEAGLQIIMSTHIQEYIQAADKVFVVKKNRQGFSEVKERVDNEPKNLQQ